MSNPFFLTRQTANLMEDFLRELKANGSVFLLYGESGVGKTRLLEELKRTRLSDREVHWVDLQAGATGDGSLVDSSAMIEDTFTGAQPGDIVIADHFEMSLQKTRHQLFLSWSTDGVDKQINLIVSSNVRFFDEIRQLAKQYQVRVQSFQLMALNSQEAAAFLGFYLFPDRPIGKLLIPALLQGHLDETKGVVGKIVEIAERAGDQITTAPMDDVETGRKDSKNIVAIFIAIALLVGGGWYYLSSQSQIDDTPAATDESLAPLEAESAVGQVLPEETESMPVTAQPGLDENGTTSETGTTGETGTGVSDADDASEVTEITEVAEVDEVTGVDETSEAGASNQGASAATVAIEAPSPEDQAMPVETRTEDAIDMTAEAGTATDEEAVLVDETASEQVEQGAAVDVNETAVQLSTEEMMATAAQEVPPAPAAASRFERELQASLDWITGSDSKTGTIQILLLSYDKFEEQVYYDYVDYLATRDVDISELKIFMTFTGGRKVYSVVYGEYESWKAAGDAIEGLPQVLRDTSPIPRSAGGLMEEIRRLETGN